MPAPVQEGPTGDETDLQLVNLLQIDPHIFWSKVGKILQMSSTAAINRWNHLVEKGLAWICTYPDPERRFTTVVEIDYRTESLPSATEQMYAYPLIMSVDEAARQCDILLTIMTPDTATLTTLTIDWIGGIDGVYGTRNSPATSVIAGAESWRANILTQRQVNQVLLQHILGRSQTGFDATGLALAQALVRDGGASVTSLPQELGMPTSTVHRGIRGPLANRHLIMQCDTAPGLMGWLLECTWLMVVAFNYKNRIIELLKEQSSLRFCF